ncbi:MAG: isoprenylcysteine carboxylmethyltransferase family protein [Alphaproteobacteria bacterium]|nr:isoprenylcysteine carboxylmethyltransferase family protein [Alphaproteobacteria bacterium SS10]
MTVPSPQDNNTPPEEQVPPVLIHPPVLVAACVTMAALLQWRWPLADATAVLPRVPLAVIGAVCIGLGGYLVVRAILTMHRAGTNVPTFKPATALVTHDVFARTRNPIYLGLVLGLLGVAIAWPSIWLVMFTLPIPLILNVAVIPQEERYMSAKFGADYTAYRERTPCWF